MMLAMTLPLEHEVQNYQGLAQYIARLAAECRQNGQDWENATLDRFLDALSACVHDHAGAASATAGTPAEWGFFAFALDAATLYE
jgi:hypothetical protein